MTKLTAALAAAGLATFALGHVPGAAAAEYWLRAEATTLTLPGPVSVPMWAFSRCVDATYSACDAPSVPGPALVVPPGEGLLVHVKNTLPEPVSIVIPGQVATMTPVWNDGSSGARPSPAARVRSFTNEAAPGGGTADYAWPAMKTGTYLYHSGTHPQVQVQMGLYGAATKDAAAGQAYPGVAYDQAVTLLYSEIDPALHAAVAGPSPTYGTAAGPTSTLNYVPRYFLVNGQPYASGTPALATVDTGKATLLRFINAGLNTHVPVIDGQYVKMIAEDGNPYPWAGNPRQRYSVFLPAAKTTDTLLTVPLDSTSTRVAIYDRTLALTNDRAGDGGMLAFLAVNQAVDPTQHAPVFTSSPVTGATYGVAYGYTATATDADPGNTVTYSLDVKPAGMTINPGSGAIAWTPAKSQVGSQAVTVRATDNTTRFAQQSFSIAVADANYAPVAVNDSFEMIQGSTLTRAAPGVLANDSDPDGDPLTATLVAAPANGTLTLNANGGFTYTPPAAATGTRSFTYRANDATHSSAVATATVTILANRPPNAVDDTATATRRTGAAYTPLVIAVLANDSDPDTAIDAANTIAPGTVTIATQPNKGGTATANPDGTVSYTPARNFRGSENFTYRVRDTRNAQSNIATVRVNIP